MEGPRGDTMAMPRPGRGGPASFCQELGEDAEWRLRGSSISSKVTCLSVLTWTQVSNSGQGG